MGRKKFSFQKVMVKSCQALHPVLVCAHVWIWSSQMGKRPDTEELLLDAEAADSGQRRKRRKSVPDSPQRHPLLPPITYFPIPSSPPAHPSRKDLARLSIPAGDPQLNATQTLPLIVLFMIIYTLSYTQVLWDRAFFAYTVPPGVSLFHRHTQRHLKMASEFEPRSTRYFKLSNTRGLFSNTRGLFGQLLA